MFALAPSFGSREGIMILEKVIGIAKASLLLELRYLEMMELFGMSVTKNMS